MALHGKLLEQLVVLLHLIIGVQLVLSAPQRNDPSCIRKCGSVDIPYPFGTRKGCYLDQSFLIICNYSFQPPKPFLGVDHNIDVLNISPDDGELRVSNLVFRRCQWWPEFDNQPSLSRISALLNSSNFGISIEKNSIFAVGCNFYAYISSSHGQDYKFMSGCVSFCGNSSGLVNGSCSGLGCCHSAIPGNTTNYNLNVQSIYTNGSGRTSGQSCGLGFIGETQAYNFSTLDFTNLTNRETVPLVLDWAIKNKTCKDAKKDMTSYLCKAANSCLQANNGLGYICKCPDGYKGNAYIREGQYGSCQDIDECKDSPYPCNATAICTNTKGSYTCTCPNGYVSDGRNPHGKTGCSRKGQSKIIIIALGASTFGVLFLLIGGWGSYKVVKKRKRIERRQKFFKRNGGLLLQQQISQSELDVANTKLFNSKDLEKATDHFNDNRILGQGGQGTVYKGMLEDGRIVAMKKSKIINEGKLQEFINEVVVLSRINHRNIVKLLGCCLETEVPLLVYEFVPNGTLSRYLSDQNEEFPPTWDMRLRIATEIAGALYYLHSATSLPIYHRDIKSTNILLDDKYRAKVADFGTSRSVAIDQTHLTTLVHGTFGYLDPEYFQSSQFTEKSDVYSFGVVLVELLTGEKAISLTRTPEAKSLATYFIARWKKTICLISLIDEF